MKPDEVDELVRQLLGDNTERRSKAEDLLEELMVRSRRGAEMISALVRAEIRRELEARAARSREELADLFERMAGLVGEHFATGHLSDWARRWRESDEGAATAEPTDGPPAGERRPEKAAAKKAAAKKAAAKEAAAGAPAKKAAKKAAAKKAGAKKAGGSTLAGKKGAAPSAAKKSPAKKAAKKAPG